MSPRDVAALMMLQKQNGFAGNRRYSVGANCLYFDHTVQRRVGLTFDRSIFMLMFYKAFLNACVLPSIYLDFLSTLKACHDAIIH